MIETQKNAIEAQENMKRIDNEFKYAIQQAK